MSISFRIKVTCFVAAAVLPHISSAESAVLVDEGPIVLHANIDQQWGGHTFAYLLEGEKCIFWSATMYNPDGKTWGSLIGQYPKPGSGAQVAVTSFPFIEPGVKSLNQPLMLRTPDGFIHVIIGLSHSTDDPNYNAGTLRYFRSAAPDDISQLVDRSELIPRTPPYNEFHLRMNAGISRDGSRAAIVILAISKDGSVPFNTPVIFLGDRKGADFVFRDPVKYAEAQGFFYPQIALTDSGTVLVGQQWDNKDRSTTRIIHLDDTGKEVHRADLPAEVDGNYWCCDFRPLRADDWSRLVLYYNKYPKGGQDCRHEFWIYEPATHTLKQHQSIAVPEGRINYGKWIPISDKRSVFLHNPSMGAFETISGDLLGDGDVAVAPLIATNPSTFGYAGTAYTFVPNPFQGSVSSSDSLWFASDYIPQKNDPKERTRGALLLYRVAVGS